MVVPDTLQDERFRNNPFVTAEPFPGFRLELRGPAAGGELLRFGQPVYLEVALTNELPRAVSLPAEILDHKGGFLQLTVRRVRTGSARPSSADAEVFQPVVHRCYALGPGSTVTLAAGASLRDNVNLTFGAGGFAFAEPGVYHVQASVVLPSSPTAEFVLSSNTVRLRVAHPQGLDEERDALVLFEREPGAFIALGGSTALPEGRDALEDVLERRLHRSGTLDPVGAALARSLALHYSRRYTRIGEESLRSGEPEHPERAAQLLGRLDDRVIEQTFDPWTAADTKRLVAEREQ